MEDGPVFKQKVGAVIQARMGSTRLPNKILMPMPFPTGKPLIGGIVDFLNQAKHVDEVVLATSVNTADDPVEIYCQENNINCYRGSEENVFSRFHEVAAKHELDVIVRVTGDNPMVDYDLMDQAIAFHIENNNHYTSTSGLPLGMNFEIVDAKELLKLDDKTLDEAEIEHVTPRFKNGDYKRGNVHFEVADVDGLRLTIDYPEDLAVASLALGFFNEPDYKQLSVMDRVSKIQNDHPWVFAMNSNRLQKKQFTNLADELTEAATVLDGLDMPRGAEIIRSANRN